ncbi:hypothetical protein [Roseovarius sp. A-2]|uniref:hypothetical protein n=1 Tax=Roseovarius sp. A-2 TaxID=1570360 RepID=UPI0011190B75|nr:hypothetical protein [Roseovarius sp. A-2]
MLKPLESILIAILLGGLPANAQSVVCPDPRFVILSDDGTPAHRVCRIAQEAAERLAACNVPLSDTRRIRIELMPEMLEACLGLYHCGKDLIQIPTPDTMQSMRAADSSLSHVPPEPFFRGILTHELAHAAFDAQPCPFESCITASEYIAYTMQIMSLPAADIATFESGLKMHKKISRDALNPITLYMNPDIFLSLAWIHLHQRSDPCAYIGDVMQGRIRMDYERH